MGKFVFAVLVCLGLFSVAQSGRADDKVDKETREQSEKRLAEMDRNLEKEEWAVKLKKNVANLSELLEKADEIDLFRLSPQRLPEGNKEAQKEFYRYEVLSKFRIKAEDNRKEAAAFLAKTLHWNELRMALCFNPRHAMRVVIEKSTVDFLICFECNRVEIFQDGARRATLPLSLTDKNNPIERLLAANEKKEKERK